MHQEQTRQVQARTVVTVQRRLSRQIRGITGREIARIMDIQQNASCFHRAIERRHRPMQGNPGIRDFVDTRLAIGVIFALNGIDVKMQKLPDGCDRSGRRHRCLRNLFVRFRRAGLFVIGSTIIQRGDTGQEAPHHPVVPLNQLILVFDLARWLVDRGVFFN